MAMADTTPSKVYDIAEKLGYEGARTQSSAKAVYACADALGFVGPHARRITDALSDLKTVVSGGGGGGVDLGPLQKPPLSDQSVPAVGDTWSIPALMGSASRIDVGSTTVAVTQGGAMSFSQVAAGAVLWLPQYPGVTFIASLVTVESIEEDEYGNKTGKVASVEEWSSNLVDGTHYTMPVLGDLTFLLIVGQYNQ